MSGVVNVIVHFFAQSREFAETQRSTLTLSQTTDYKTIKEQLLLNFPRLNELKNCFVIAVNEEYVGEEDRISLKENDKIAVIPPLSGG